MDGKNIWALLGPHAGDNMQVRVLAEALCASNGWQLALKELPLKKSLVPNVLKGPGTGHLAAQGQEILAGPWPGVLIFSGKRAVRVARWIAKQSGGKTLLVAVGRPRAPLSWFDLVITTPQYDLPTRHNVLELPLPLIRPRGDDHPVAKRCEQWGELPRPLIGVLVGGGRLPLKLTLTVVVRLTQQLRALANETGGTVLACTAPRTDAGITAALIKGMQDFGQVFDWRTDKQAYGALLACADRFVVTSDSAMMIAEAVETGKPVAVFDLDKVSMLPGWSGKAGPGRWLAETGVITPPRDMGKISQQVTGGRDLPNAQSRLQMAVERINQLSPG